MWTRGVTISRPNAYEAFALPLSYKSKIYCGGKRTRTSEPEGEHLQCPAIATMRYPQLLYVPMIGLEPIKPRA